MTRPGRTRAMILTALIAALTALGAFFRIPLGSTSVTLQFFFTALGAVLLGVKWGMLSQIVYVLLGLVGLPIFTLGGGPGYILQPSFGFLLALIPAAGVIAALAGDGKSTRRITLACVAGDAVLYLIGIPYMYLILNVYMGKGLSLCVVLLSGMLIYLPGDVLKIIAVIVLAKPLTRALRRPA